MSDDGAQSTKSERFWHWLRDNQTMLENIARGVIVIAVLASMFLFGHAADPGAKAKVADRILSWSFVVFAVGLAELFALFVVMSVLGKIDLARAFYDKPLVDTDVASQAAAASDTPPVSLARLQAFMWTLVVMTVYFHRVVRDQSTELPPIPPELLMVMGISGAVYLTSKGIDKTPAPPPKPKAEV